MTLTNVWTRSWSLSTVEHFTVEWRWHWGWNFSPISIASLKQNQWESNWWKWETWCMLDESFRIRHVGHCGTEQWPRELWFVFEHFLAVFWTQKCWMFACKDMLWKFGSSTANWRSTVWNGVSLISWRSMPETKSLACNDMRALTAKFCRCRTAWCDFQKCRSEDPQPGCFIFLLVWFWFASNPLPAFFWAHRSKVMPAIDNNVNNVQSFISSQTTLG